MKAIPIRFIAAFIRASALCTLLLAASSSFAAISETIKTPKSIRVVMDDNYPPYVFKDDQGQLKGITVDQWGLWEKRTGIHVELSGMDWGEAQRKMQAGEFDVIDTMFKNEKREMVYDFTKPYARLDVPLFFHEDISGIRGPDDLQGFLVAAKAGDNSIDILKKHGVTTIVEYPSYERLIEAARDGKAMVFIVDRPPALYFLNRMGIQRRFRETAPLYSGEFHRAVMKGRGDLLTIVEKGFADITPAEYRSIEKNWMGTQISSVTYFRYAGYTAAVIAVFVAGLLAWLRLLKRAVSMKTRELSNSEESLLKNEAHYRSLFDSSLIGVTVTNREFIITDANDAFCKMLKYSKDELIGSLSIADVSHPDDVDISIENLRKLMTHELDQYSFEKRFITKTGETIDGLLYVRGQYNLNGEYEGTTASILDISEYKRADTSLRESEEKYRNLFNNSEVAIFRTRLDGSEVLDVNQKFLDMLGKTRLETLGNPSDMLWADPKEREEMVRRLLADGRVSGYEYKMLDQQGGIKNCITSLVLYREQSILEGSILDITNLKRAEEDRILLEKQLLHAQKLESLGVLAGGIAHDFNNILTAIMGNADLALMRMNPESPAIDNLHNIEKAASRAADLAKQMLAYSGKGKFVVENLDLNRLLEEMLHMLEVSISKKAVLRFNRTPLLPSVEADATQMQQIVMNLVINASEAIGDKSGVIAITTGCMDCDKTYLKQIWLEENITAGLYVYLEIVDTGCGMDGETLARLFDPFFTTKFSGRGLGMAAVLGIVKGHKGAINVYSEPNKGTTFKILLPASSRPAEIFNHDSHKDDWKGEGKVLLVDDEETIRGVGRAMLQEFGFTTITANDGREAVDIFKQNPDFAFIILDLTMPHMDGEQCFRELKQLKPDVKIIMSSGFSEHEVYHMFVGKGLAGFIQKPYKLSVLKEAIRKI